MKTMVKADHEILVTLKQGEYGPEAIPSMVPVMRLGETVHYSSASGEVKVEFGDPKGAKSKSALDTPYLNADGGPINPVTSEMPPLKLSKRGTFPFQCYIKQAVMGVGGNAGKAKEKWVGWGPDSPQSGANHVVI